MIGSEQKSLGGQGKRLTAIVQFNSHKDLGYHFVSLLRGKDLDVIGGTAHVKTPAIPRYEQLTSLETLCHLFYRGSQFSALHYPMHLYLTYEAAWEMIPRTKAMSV